MESLPCCDLQGGGVKAELWTKEQALEFVRRDGFDLRQVSEEFRDDSDVVKAALEQSYFALAFASDRLRDDLEIVSYATGKALLAVKNASKRIRGSKEIMLPMIAADGLLLSYASQPLKGDFEVALAAVRSNGLAIRYVSKQLKDNVLVVAEAIRKNPMAEVHAGLEVRKIINHIPRAEDRISCLFEAWHKTKVFNERQHMGKIVGKNEVKSVRAKKL